MKRVLIGLGAAALAATLATPVMAGNGAPSGKHYNVNIIGVPKAEQSDFLGGNADTSNGRTIFIPLKTSKVPKNFVGGVCTTPDGTQTDFVDEEGPTFFTEEPEGKTRIYFEANTDGVFEITDRDAVDGRGEISIPVDPNDGNSVLVDLWVRVLGKPGGCAEISGYAYEDPNDGGLNTIELWWYSGSILVNRKGGKSSFVNATEIFDVDYCEVEEVDDGMGGTVLQCVSGTTDTLSVFNDIFSEYFWEVNNHNTRLIQMRFYLRDPSPTS